MDRLQFLRTSLSIQHDKDLASHLSAAYRASTIRQAQLNWKVFQQWLPVDFSDIMEDIILRFLIYLDEVKKLSPHCIMNYKIALAHPLQLAFGVNMSHRSFNLLARSQFLQRPPTAKKIPTWSFEAALVTFSQPEFNPPEASTEKLLLKSPLLHGPGHHQQSHRTGLQHHGGNHGHQRTSDSTCPKIISFQKSEYQSPIRTDHHLSCATYHSPLPWERLKRLPQKNDRGSPLGIHLCAPHIVKTPESWKTALLARLNHQDS
ncbi:hypothetical protein Pcinc_014101 [Petrolisthes cinctipes]|uniref:Uncharacterized protein n=1 Tax=Petrolisthes cinctipes TaxID=88211 RepID=A0AAE1FW08_PETCI|nr:hypothetical protein Pcinc_014101 [Petrolisthes cinctipes]